MNRRPALGIFLLALALRLIYIADLGDYEFLDRLHLDPKAYDDKATAILAGESSAPGRPFYQAPLYPYFLAAIYRAAGHDYGTVRILQAFLGGGTVLLVAAAGALAFGPAAGAVAGLLAALYAPFPFYEAQIMKTGPGVFLLMAGVFLLLRSRGARGALLGGACLGLAALVRENALLMIAAGAAGVAWGRGPGEGSVRRGLLVLLGGAVAVAPVTIRNAVVSGGDFVLVTSQGGQNFYIGNNEEARGTYTDLPFVRPDPRHEETDFRRETARRLGREPAAPAISRFWYGESWRWMKSNPGAAVSLFGRKLLLFWNAVELPDNENFYYLRDRFAALRLFPLTFGVVAALGLVGLAASLRRFRSLFLLYAGVGTVYASLAAFYVFSRYRLAAAPFLILFAAEGVRTIAAALRERAWRKLALLLGALLAGLLLAYGARPIDFDPRVDGYLPLHVNRAMIFAEEGDRARAIDEYRAALAIAPDRSHIRKRLATLLREEGREEEALAEIDRLVREIPNDAGLRNDRALLLLRLGESDRALHGFREAIRIDPTLEEPHRNLGRLCEEMGLLEEGERERGIAESLRAAGGRP